MRKLFGVLAGVGAVVVLAAFTPAREVVVEMFAGQGPPINLAARQETYRGDPQVVLNMTDTNSQTVVYTKIRRRSTGADTFWVVRGYTTGVADSINATLRKRMIFRDPGVSFGKIYRYQAADSVSGAAVTAWSDSVSITVTNFTRSQ